MHKDRDTIIWLSYVDDLFITGSNDTLISWLKNFLKIEFDMTNFGKIKRYFGISFEHVNLGTLLHQHDYAISILQEFGIQDYKPASTPLPQGQILVKDTNSLYTDLNYYCHVIGKLIFLIVTRPNIAYAVNKLRSYIADPHKTHFGSSQICTTIYSRNPKLWDLLPSRRSSYDCRIYQCKLGHLSRYSTLYW